MSVDVIKSQERSKFRSFSWHFRFDHCVCREWCNFKMSRTDKVFYAVDHLADETTFLKLESDA